MSTNKQQKNCRNPHPQKNAGTVDVVAAPTFLGIPKDKFRDIIYELPVYLWMHDEDYTIVNANNSFKDKYGDCIGKLCHQCIQKSDTVCKCCISAHVLKSNSGKKCTHCSCAESSEHTHTFHRPIVRIDGSKYVLKSTIVMDNMHQWLKEFEEKQEEPSEDIANIFWSMCSSCKNIKDDKGNWINLENFLTYYFNIVISHGICPDCIEKLYPEIRRR